MSQLSKKYLNFNRWTPRLVVVALSLVVMLFFQNCGQSFQGLSTRVNSAIDIAAQDEIIGGVVYETGPPTEQYCVLDGRRVASGNRAVAYEVASPVGTPCKSEERLCDKGVLSGSYSFISCTMVNAPPAPVLVGWKFPANSSESLGPGSVPIKDNMIASAPNGDLVFVWIRDVTNASKGYIFKSERRNGVWIHPKSVEDALNYNVSSSDYLGYYPTVKMDKMGNTIVAWSQSTSNGNKTRIYKAEFRNGKWSLPMSQDDYLMPGNESNLAMSDNGTAIVVSSSFNDAGYTLYKNHYKDGVWESRESMAPMIPTSALFQTLGAWPQVGMDENGNALIAWTQWGGGVGSTLYTSEYRNGKWRHPQSLEDAVNYRVPGRSNVANYVKLVMNKKGHAILAWEQYADGPVEEMNDLYLAEYNNGSWKKPQSTADKLNFTGVDYMTGTSIAMDDAGDVIFAFAQGSQLYKMERKNNVWSARPTSATERINPPGAVFYPQVAMDNNSKASIFYLVRTKEGMGLYHSDYSGGQWAHPQSVKDSTGFGNAGKFQVTLNNSGSNSFGAVVWTGRLMVSGQPEARLYLGTF